MKNHLRAKNTMYFAVMIAGFLTACSPKSFTSLTVVRDCTGTYVRNDTIDYPVCNPIVLNDIPEGSKARVSIKTHSENSTCEAQEGIRCMMVHPFQTGEWIEVLKVKKAN